MKVLGILAALLFGLLAVLFFGAIIVAALKALCETCPYKDKCDENFDCPYDHMTFHDNNSINLEF